MLKIGLTGGIGTGKSTVASIFSVYNIPVLNADNISKFLIHNNKDLQADITQQFGRESFSSDGTYNSKFISSIVFNDAEKLKALNDIVHPYVNQFSDRWWQEQSEKDVPYAIKEAAILIESGLNESLDYIIGVDAPLDIRIERIERRDGLSRDEIMNRMNRQMNNDEKMLLCDFVIQNNDSDSLIEQVLNIHNKLLHIIQL